MTLNDINARITRCRYFVAERLRSPTAKAVIEREIEELEQKRLDLELAYSCGLYELPAFMQRQAE